MISALSSLLVSSFDQNLNGGGDLVALENRNRQRVHIDEDGDVFLLLQEDIFADLAFLRLEGAEFKKLQRAVRAADQ